MDGSRPTASRFLVQYGNFIRVAPARRILLEVEEADEAAVGINATPRGHLAVTAPVLFGKIYVMPIITAYQTAFTETTVSALFVDRVANLVDEGLDVGIPKTPVDLAQHPVIAATSVSAGSDWTFAKGKEKIGVRLSPRILVNTNDGALEAARSGFGLTRLISYQVANELAAGTLTTVLADFEEASLPVHVIHREGRNGSAKVRSFVDLAVERLRADKALQ